MTGRSGVVALARDDIRRLSPYQPENTGCAIDLSDNTNLWGSPPAALRALREMPASAFSRYPSLYSEPLHAALLRYSVPVDAQRVHVVTGCGSDDVLDSAMRAFGAPGDRIVFSTPTFSMIPYLVHLNGLAAMAVPFRPAGDIDAERLVDAKAKITYLCSPNNPTGSAIARDAVEFVIDKAHGLVVLDEAYAEFAPEVFDDLLVRSERLLIVRTFSKAFGLAGLRVGYGVGSTHESDRFPAAIRAGSTLGVQFQPEKSSMDGVRFLHAFLRESTRTGSVR